MWHFSASYKIHTKTSTQTQTVNIPSYACVFQHGSSWWEIGFARTVDCQTPVVASAIQSTNKNSLKIMKRSTTTNTQRNQSRSAGWRVTWPLSRALLKQKYAIMPTCTVHLAWYSAAAAIWHLRKIQILLEVILYLQIKYGLSQCDNDALWTKNKKKRILN